MIGRALILLALLTSVPAMGQNMSQMGNRSNKPICGVIRQQGVVRGGEEPSRIDLVLPCEWTDDEMLAAWRHRPDPLWGCGGFNMDNPGKPNCGN